MTSNHPSETIRERLRFIKNAPPGLEGDQGDFITRHLHHNDPTIRALAVECMWDFPDKNVADTILSLARDDPDESVRTSAITVLGRYMYEGEMEMYELEAGPWEDPYVEPVMTMEQYERMRDFLIATYQGEKKSLDERRYALEALSFLYRDDVKQFIREAYGSNEKPMKLSAVFAMGRNGSMEWRDYLLESLASEDREIRAEAIHSIGECRIEEAHDLVLSIAQTTMDQNEFRTAVMAIAKLGLQRSFPFLDNLNTEARVDVDTDFAEVAVDEWMFNSEIRRHEEDEDLC